MSDPARQRAEGTPPGPPAPPFIPGHMGAPSYEECVGMLCDITYYALLRKPHPPEFAWRIGPWQRRLGHWAAREAERDPDRMVEAIRKHEQSREYPVTNDRPREHELNLMNEREEAR